MSRNRPGTRLTISNPAAWIAAVKEQAEREGQSLSEWLYLVSVVELDKDLARKLTDRPAFGRPKEDEE